MKRLLAFFAAVIVILPFMPASAQSVSPFHRLAFEENRQFVLHCAAGFECDIQLEAGERVNDGFNAHMEDWDPHIGYSGVDKVTPHLVLRPTAANLRTNIILTTTKRTYYLLAISTDRTQPSYYSFAFTDETFHELTRISTLTQAALRASGSVPLPDVTATPSNVARLASTCIDYDYSYVVDRSLQNDRPPHARPSTERLPKSLEPRVVCTDGTHTYVEFPRAQEAPADIPISLAVTTEGDTLIDYTYVATLNRFTIDGVYDSFALEVGSQDQPLRIRIYHGKRGNPPTDPKPIRIGLPPDLDQIDRPIVPMQTPLVSTVPTYQPIDQRQPTSYVPTPAPTPIPVASAAPAAFHVLPIIATRAPEVAIASLTIGGRQELPPVENVAIAAQPFVNPIVFLEVGPAVDPRRPSSQRTATHVSLVRPNL